MVAVVVVVSERFSAKSQVARMVEDLMAVAVAVVVSGRSSVAAMGDPMAVDLTVVEVSGDSLAAEVTVADLMDTEGVMEAMAGTAAMAATANPTKPINPVAVWAWEVLWPLELVVSLVERCLQMRSTMTTLKVRHRILHHMTELD